MLILLAELGSHATKCNCNAIIGEAIEFYEHEVMTYIQEPSCAVECIFQIQLNSL